VLLAATPASAHGEQVLLKVTAASASAGVPAKVTAVATFLDGDKAGGVPLTAAATGPGKRVSARLKASGPRGTYTANLRLAPGRWKITVTAGGEHTGRGSTTLTVAAPPTTTVTTTTTPPTTTTAPPDTSLAAQPAAANTTSTGGRGPVLAIVLVAAIVLLAVGILLTVQRRRNQPS
jgi:hypothetical protein